MTIKESLVNKFIKFYAEKIIGCLNVKEEKNINICYNQIETEFVDFSEANTNKNDIDYPKIINNKVVPGLKREFKSNGFKFKEINETLDEFPFCSKYYRIEK